MTADRIQSAVALLLGTACVLFGLVRDEVAWAPIGFGVFAGPGVLRLSVVTAAATVKLTKEGP